MIFIFDPTQLAEADYDVYLCMLIRDVCY